MKNPLKKPLTKDLLITLCLVVLALISITSAGVVSYDSFGPSELGSRIEAKELETIKSRAILSHTEPTDGIITYTYAGEALPEKLAENEVREKRTEKSFTTLIGYENKGTSQEKVILSTVFYPQDTFIERGGSWYYVEYDTAREGTFKEAQKQDLVSSLFWKKVHADTFFAGAGDGYVSGTASLPCTTQANWDNAHDSPLSYIGGPALATVAAGWSSTAVKYGSFCAIYRGFLPFDTSSIPAAATISGASLSVYVATVNNVENDGIDYLTVVQTSQATHTTLAAADYGQCGAVNNPTEGVDPGERKDLTSISTSAYLTFTLNSTGHNWIKKSGQSSNCTATAGITCLGLREGHDTSDSKPDISTPNQGNMVNYSNSEATGTSQDPYLSVTYSINSYAFWQWSDF